MDPTTAVNMFNDPTTCRAERAEIAVALWEWFGRGGFRPPAGACRVLNREFVTSLRSHHELDGAAAAELCNEIMATLQEVSQSPNRY